MIELLGVFAALASDGATQADDAGDVSLAESPAARGPGSAPKPER